VVAKKKPYAQRDDLERIQSQWTKLSGLHSDSQWSAAVVRAATAAELAANLAVRKEFENTSDFHKNVVDHFLFWANGLSGKISKLLIPMTAAQPHGPAVRALQPVSDRINQARNKVVHQGEFCNSGEAQLVIADARLFVETLVGIFHPAFELTEKRSVETDAEVPVK
jgi:hypothetical protein